MEGLNKINRNQSGGGCTNGLAVPQFGLTNGTADFNIFTSRFAVVGFGFPAEAQYNEHSEK